MPLPPLPLPPPSSFIVPVEPSLPRYYYTCNAVAVFATMFYTAVETARYLVSEE